jgi:hypothetical protein
MTEASDSLKPNGTPPKKKRLEVVKHEWLAVVYSFCWFFMLMSKNFMDTVVIRGSDTATSTVFVQLKNLFGSVATISWIVLPLTLVWIAIGWSLGNQAREKKLANKSVV